MRLKKTMMNDANRLNDIITGEDYRLKRSDNPFLETGYMGSAIALFSLSRILKNENLSKIAENHLSLMRVSLKDKSSLEINNGLAGVGLGLTWLAEEKFISGDLNLILKNIDDRIYRYCVKSISEYTTKYESSYLDMLLYIGVRINYLKKDDTDYAVFVRLAQMLYDHVYFNISMGFFIEPRPAGIRYKLFLFLIASWLFCRNGDVHLRNRVSKAFNEILDIIVTIQPFCSVNRYMLHMAIDLLIPYFEDNVEKWKDYSQRLERDTSVEQMIDETLDNDMSVFHGLPYIYLILKYGKYSFSYPFLSVIKNKIDEILSLYSNYKDCENWDYVGLSGIMGTMVVLEDIKSQLTHE